MDLTPLPDHYAALGVDKTADAATIKKTYRRLVLSCHPDKVTDAALKQQKQEEFHKIQQAYEVLGDEDKRATYEAELKLDLLRRDRAARAAASPSKDAKTARFDTRTPSGAYPSTGSPRYTTEERKPSHAYDDRRKYDETYPRPSPQSRSSRPEKEPSARTARPTPERTQSERIKTPRDRDDRRERKFTSPEGESSSSSDEKARFEAKRKHLNAEEEARKQAEARRKADEQRRYDDSRYTSASRKLSLQEEEAIRYQHRSRAEVQAEMRPSPTRAASRDYYSSERTPSRREAQLRPEPVRRSSARPKERPAPTGRERERIVDWEPPTFKHSASMPADMQVPRSMPPPRAFTTEVPLPREHRRADTSPPPAFHRSSTLPPMPSPSSSRRKESTARPSGLREPMVPEHTSPTSQTKQYYYPTPGGGVPLRPEDVGSASAHRTVLREPEHYRQRSPSPLARPPIGANRHEGKYTSTGLPPPPMGRASTSRNVSPVRGRQQPLNPDHMRRENARRQKSFSPEKVAYAKKIGPEDVRWAPRESASRGQREYASKPTLGRTATYVY